MEILEMPIEAPTLTRREIEVLTLFANGKTARQIAHSLGISKRTADAHRQAIIQKLGASNIASAVAVGILKGIIQPLSAVRSEKPDTSPLTD